MNVVCRSCAAAVVFVHVSLALTAGSGCSSSQPSAAAPPADARFGALPVSAPQPTAPAAVGGSSPVIPAAGSAFPAEAATAGVVARAVPAAGGSWAGSSGAASAQAGAAGLPGSAGGPSAGAAAPLAAASGPLVTHGELHVTGGRVVDAAGRPLQLRGMSLFWSQWSDYYTASVVDQLADDWHAGLVRAALGVENGGYLEQPAENEAKVVSVVDRAIERGMYVIIDWHDHHAQDHQAAAMEFFTRMAKKYGSSPGVIFEIFNEPLAVSWPSVKAYAEPMIRAIRAAGAKNLILVGTPNWSQDVDAAAANPITGQADVAYVLHFYAATHKQALRDKALKAVSAGLPLFVTEWGTCESTGSGTVSESETKAWLDLLAKNQISWANWALNDKDEACSALKPGAGITGPWTEAALTQSGGLVKALMR